VVKTHTILYLFNLDLLLIYNIYNNINNLLIITWEPEEKT